MANNNKIDDWEDIPVESSQVDDWEDVSDNMSVSPQSAPIDNIMTDVIIPKAQSGLTMGFSDELTGALSAMPEIAEVDPLSPQSTQFTQGKSKEELLKQYKESRDAVRQQNLTAEEQYPATSFAAEMGGGLLVPGGIFGKVAGKSASLGSKILTGAKIGAPAGAVAGAGMSEADLSSPENLEEFSGDIAMGTGTGALTGGAVPLIVPAVTAPIKLAKGATKMAKDLAMDIPTIEDMLNAYRYGKKGEKVVGSQAFDTYGKQAMSLAKTSAVDLSKEGNKLAREQAEILENAPETFDVLKHIRSFKEEGSELPMVGSRAKSDISQVKGISNDMIYEYGLSRDQKNVFNQLNKNLEDLDKMKSSQKMTDIEYKDLKETLEVEKEKLMNLAYEKLQNLEAKDVNKIKKSFTGMTDVTSQSDIPELRTRDAQNLAKSKSQDITEEMYESMPRFAEQNELIHEFNKAMDSLKLDKVNEKFLTSKDEANVKRKLFDIIKNAKRETDSSIIARDAIDQLNTVLQKTNPELANKLIPKMTDVASKLDLAKKSIGSGNLIGNVLSLGGRTITAANTVGMWSKQMSDLNPKQLQQLSGMVSKVGSQTSQELSRILNVAAEATPQRRRAMTFALMQNPTYREILGINEDERSK